MLDPKRVKGFKATVGLQLGNGSFVARVHDG